jgi:hypothetical protein
MGAGDRLAHAGLRRQRAKLSAAAKVTHVVVHKVRILGVALDECGDK